MLPTFLSNSMTAVQILIVAPGHTVFWSERMLPVYNGNTALSAADFNAVHGAAQHTVGGRVVPKASPGNALRLAFNVLNAGMLSRNWHVHAGWVGLLLQKVIATVSHAATLGDKG